MMHTNPSPIRRRINFTGLSLLSTAFQSTFLDKPQYVISATNPDGAISPFFPPKEGGQRVFLDILTSDPYALFFSHELGWQSRKFKIKASGT